MFAIRVSDLLHTARLPWEFHHVRVTDGVIGTEEVTETDRQIHTKRNIDVVRQRE